MCRKSDKVCAASSDILSTIEFALPSNSVITLNNDRLGTDEPVVIMDLTSQFSGNGNQIFHADSDSDETITVSTRRVDETTTATRRGADA